ncbi:SDR family oxidoreductase [Panacibacter ginsenosidivorans]|uniref:SDR family oxidoreductase n=1 Tax=Panacibacter ginsenosidivorans TaxID=1813871 RepID=A0A5B8VEY4_9BACT|nr:SDR family oxidoreductase [Panacibacter ginsenosidivorans]QEC69066.1 SDR family oxidoreductase [Panacibacter ginsenosidivorans]
MNNNPVNIQDEVILVTGAFGLIGKQISKAFLQNGAKVVLADINVNALNAIQDEFAELFSTDNFLVTQLDITDEQSAASVVQQTADKFGKLDVLINNAAIDAKFDKDGMSKVNQSRFENYPVDLLRRSVDVNLTGTVIMTQAACKQMLTQGFGNIINVASTYSVVAPNQNLYDFGNGIENFKPIDYIASKSFIPNFTRYIATFYAVNNIRCNAIVPHGVYNNHDQKFLDNFSKMSPMGRMCNREELEGPFIFLASKASSYMTGSVMMVDGGWTAW